MIILGIETSCDETAASVVKGTGNKVEVLSNVVASQIEIHKKYGGVVPEVAARQHVLNILPVVNEALEKAGIQPPLFPPCQGGEFSPLVRGAKNNPPYPSASARARRDGPLSRGINAIAVTVGPGLVTSLLVGVETAKTLAFAWRAPVVAVNHIEGHIYANWLKPIRVNSKFEIRNSKPIQNSKFRIQNKIKFPAMILTVSGGHTMLVLMSDHGKYKVLGQTRDDAAGEAFDKAAQLLGIGYPGGPAIAAEAAKVRRNTIPLTPFVKGAITLPRPMINSGDFDFSFSGLKTALFYQLQKDPLRPREGVARKKWQEKIPEYAAEFQQAAVDVLVYKTIKAAMALNCQTVMLSGGVAANSELRSQLKTAVKEELAGAKLIIPEFEYCTDNAAMIATAGYYRAKRKKFTLWQKLKTQANKEFK